MTHHLWMPRGNRIPWRLELTFRAPTRPRSENWVRGAHWAKAREALAPWRDVAWASARNATLQSMPKPWEPVPVVIAAEIPFPQVRGRDPHNYVGTVVKAMVDGIVRAKIVPDDTPEWVTVMEPRLVVQSNPGERLVRVVITERN